MNRRWDEFTFVVALMSFLVTLPGAVAAIFLRVSVWLPIGTGLLAFGLVVVRFWYGRRLRR